MKMFRRALIKNIDIISLILNIKLFI